MINRRDEQLEFRQSLPVVVGNADYREHEARLLRIDELLRLSGVEEAYIKKCLGHWITQGRKEAELAEIRFKEPSGKDVARYEQMCRLALRCNIARQLTQKEYRKFSLRLAESNLLQWFCRLDRMDQVRVPGKSTLARYDKLLPESQVRELIDQLNRAAVDEANQLEMESALTLKVYLSDTTCVKANIHFPTDWVLLRDGVRTLMKAVKVIRKHGLKYRMPDPDSFLREINRLSIEMSQSRRRQDSKKRRKAVLRNMKRLAKIVRNHATRYSCRLQERWEKETDLREGNVRQITERIRGIVEQLPAAIRQAHERIIGDRKVENKDKILSLYESDIHVVVRNKADSEVEFGNTLFLAEQADGLIVDWKLEKSISPGDIAFMKESLIRMKSVFERYPSAVGADRGFSSQASHKWLKAEGITDAICSRNPEMLREQMKDPVFRKTQKRRAQTEGRIGILKNAFLGRPLLSKGFEHRELAVAWAILAHNLRFLAALPQKSELQKAA